LEALVEVGLGFGVFRGDRSRELSEADGVEAYRLVEIGRQRAFVMLRRQGQRRQQQGGEKQ
jgi:hypothetical protein